MLPRRRRVPLASSDDGWPAGKSRTSLGPPAASNQTDPRGGIRRERHTAASVTRGGKATGRKSHGAEFAGPSTLPTFLSRPTPRCRSRRPPGARRPKSRAARLPPPCPTASPAPRSTPTRSTPARGPRTTAPTKMLSPRACPTCPAPGRPLAPTPRCACACAQEATRR